MTASNFDRALEVVLRHEGGFVNDPRDPGGATKFGITRATLARFRGKAVAVSDVQALERAEAAQIYRDLYWAAARCDDLPSGLDLAVFDLAVNSGPRRAAIMLQRLLAVPADAIVGPQTLERAAAKDVAALVRALTAARLDFLQRLTTWPVFGSGWRRRVADVERHALALAATARKQGPSTSQENTMTATKTWFASRTVWANLIGLACTALSAFGFDASGVSAEGLADAVTQLIAAGSFIASTIFRISATKRLA